MATVVASLIIPPLLQLSPEKLLYLGLFAVGLVLTLRDGMTLAKRRLRQGTLNLVETTVLDDVLRSIFDPETGWIACWVSLFVGNATMYTLPMSDEQRVRLVQSCLWTSEEQARTILTSPGGFKVMLPDNIQLWLDQESSALCSPTLDASKCDIDGSDHECDSSNQSEETEPSEEEMSHVLNASSGPPRGLDGFSSQLKSGAPVERKPATKTRNEIPDPATQTSRKATPGTAPTIRAHPPYPLDAMGSILKEIASDAMKRTCTGVPDSVIQTVGVVASAALALHLTCSPRARRIVAGAVEGTAALTLASVAAGAIAALVTKAHVTGSQQGDGATREIRYDVSSISRSLLIKLKDACISGGGGIRRLQGIIAVLVLLYVGRRRTRHLHRFQHVRP